MECVYQHCRNKIGMNGVVVWEKEFRMFRQFLNLVNSRRCQDEDCKEMYQNAKRTCRACRAIVFAHKTQSFAAYPYPSSFLRKLPINSQTSTDSRRKASAASLRKVGYFFP